MAPCDWVAATATLATPATLDRGLGQSVATVATVAVAAPPNGTPSLNGHLRNRRVTGYQEIAARNNRENTGNPAAAAIQEQRNINMVAPAGSPLDRDGGAVSHELRRLVAVLFGNDTETHQADALAAALADAEAALTSFRALAADATERARHEARFGRA